jgi:arylsulfatase A-like enzyme
MGSPRHHSSQRAGLALAALAAVLLAACSGSGGGKPRNVLLISLDTLRPDHLGCYGHARETSPTIDALAAEGVRFAQALSPAPWTLPSHASMFTGLYPSHHGVKDYTHRLPEGVLTLAEILAQQGFQTGAVVNTWNIANPSFEIFQGIAPADVHYVRESVPGPGGSQRIANTGPEVAARAQAWLAARDRARPFFLFAHFYDAHTDFTPDEEYRRRFVSPYPAGRLDGSTGQLYALRDRGVRLGADDLRHLRELYEAEIRQLDDVLAGFLAFLDEQGLSDETLIVLTSDHGEEFQEHGGLLHGRTQFEELLRVPLILAGPGVPRGVVVEQPVGLIDLLPTILGRLELALPSGIDGLDLAPTWSGTDLAQRPFFGEADHNNVVDGKSVIDIKRMVRLGHEKLHLDRHTGREALYDLARDPLEQRDLASSAPERAAALRELLTRFGQGARGAEASGKQLSGEELQLLQQLGYAGEHEPGGSER